jgi:hypothetical protein
MMLYNHGEPLMVRDNNHTAKKTYTPISCAKRCSIPSFGGAAASCNKVVVERGGLQEAKPRIVLRERTHPSPSKGGDACTLTLLFKDALVK